MASISISMSWRGAHSTCHIWLYNVIYYLACEYIESVLLIVRKILKHLIVWQKTTNGPEAGSTDIVLVLKGPRS